jgi:integrase
MSLPEKAMRPVVTGPKRVCILKDLDLKVSGASGSQRQQVSRPSALRAQNAVFFVSGDEKQTKKKYRHLLEHEDVRRWYNNMSRGSKITADVNFRRLGYITTAKNILPQKLAKKAAKDEKWAYNFLLDIVTEMECQNYAGSYISSNVKALKSWFSHNGVELKRKIKIKGVADTPSLKDKQAPTQSQLRTLYLNSPPQARCAQSLMAESGLRPEVIGYYDGSDGLIIGDIPEMKIEHQGSSNNNVSITFVKIPCMVIVRKEISKAGHQYFTFMPGEACEYLREYLYLRAKSGEVLTPESPVIAPAKSEKPFLTAVNVGKIIRTYMRKVGINCRPYDLRHTFDTQLMLAESRGLILRDYRVFFMGHKGDIEHTYTLNKHSLPEAVVEDMRKAFLRSASFLQSSSSTLGADGPANLRDESYRRMLLLAGYTEEEIDKENILQLDDEEIAKKARERLLKSVNREALVANSGQKVVPLDELPDYLSKGWKCDHIIESRQQVIVSCGDHPQLGQ